VLGINNNKDDVLEAIIFNNICPDIILANRRIAKLKALALKEINSMIIKNGKIGIGEPGGKKEIKKRARCNSIPHNTIITKEENDKKKVTIIELVIV